MKLTSLSLYHFRSHKKTQLTVDSRPVVITGPNGAGKTNLLEAISLLSPGRGLRRARKDQLSKHPEKLGWKVTAELEDPLAGGVEIETACDLEGPRQVRINGKLSPQNALASLLRVIWLTPAMDRLWIESAEGRRRFLDRMTLSFIPEHAEAVLLYEKAMRERNRLLKDNIHNPHWFQLIEQRMADHGAAIIRGREIALHSIQKAQADSPTEFPKAMLSVDLNIEFENQNSSLNELKSQILHDHIKDTLSRALETNRSKDLAAGRSLLGPHRSDLNATYVEKNMLAADCSTGEQKALLISLMLANCRALAQELGTPPLLLLDEGVAHLDANRRKALFDELDALSTQAWISGTDKTLFEAFKERAQYIEVVEDNGLSCLKS